MPGIRRVGDAHVPMTRFAGCFFVRAAAVRSSFVDGAIEAIRIASEHARKTPAASGKGKLGAAIRQLRGDVPCTPSEIAATVLDDAA
jgi:hypothetical protein